jgi:uncharacterized protein
MDNGTIIKKTAEYVKQKFENFEGSHDWWHIYRVWQTAKHIAKEEKVDMFIVELAALLHDIADFKYHDADENLGAKTAREWLESLDVDKTIVDHVCSIVKHISFKGALIENMISTKEGNVVQDADRLDSLGAIGIARAFAYGGSKDRPLYTPGEKHKLHNNVEDYVKNGASTIAHFYEKMLLLRDRMNTEAGRRLAKKRHVFMEDFLERFYQEWDGKDL